MTGSCTWASRSTGYGWHPPGLAAHCRDRSRCFSGRYWVGLAATAERGLLDFVTIDDTLTPQRRREPELEPAPAGRPADAVLVAARVAPDHAHIGLMPVATVTHTEPFHVSKAIATLDYVSHGRAGWQARVSGAAHEAALFGRRDRRSAATCSTRRPTPSRWCAGCGTVGKTTR